MYQKLKMVKMLYTFIKWRAAHDGWINESNTYSSDEKNEKIGGV